ncbi:MAG: NAD-dependent epimerase/dehydratase family protein [Actinobacteria bacterium]|nr:NAD-dependent epimerase/dehydratase family protein [Actinomycetota bacterium]
MSETHVVLGAAGFIGSHLVDRLLSDGHNVIGIDDFSSGNLENLSQAKEADTFEFRECNISDAIPQLQNVDVIYNLASLASPKKYLSNPLHTLRSGSYGTDHSLELARQHNARIIYVSTSEIYGDPLVHPQTEDYWGNTNPIGVRSCYDEAKRFGEALTMAYVRTHKISAGIVRVFNTYGPRLDPTDGRVISNLIVQSLSNAPQTIFGSGQQTRSFCFVSDLVEGLVRFAASSSTGPLNLGNPRETTILELARLISSIAGVDHEVEFHDIPEDDPQRRQPDITRAVETIGWRPVVSLESGLAQTIKWYRERLSI